MLWLLDLPVTISKARGRALTLYQVPVPTECEGLLADDDAFATDLWGLVALTVQPCTVVRCQHRAPGYTPWQTILLIESFFIPSLFNNYTVCIPQTTYFYSDFIHSQLQFTKMSFIFVKLLLWLHTLPYIVFLKTKNTMIYKVFI